MRITQQILSLCTFFFRAESDVQSHTVTRDTGMTDSFFTELRTHIASQCIHTLLNGCTHIHFQQEVNATTQVKTQVHRQSTKTQEPLRSIRNQVQCHHISRIGRIRIQSLFNHFLGLQLQLCLRRFETNTNRRLLSALLEENAIGFDLSGLERSIDLRINFLIDLHGRFLAGDLHGRRLTEEVRRRVDHADDQSDGNDDVFPQRITIHVIPPTRKIPIKQAGFLPFYERKKKRLSPSFCNR